MRRFLKTALCVLGVLALLFLLAIVAITVDGLTDTAREAHIAVVLGNEVKPDGSLSNRLKARLDKALDLYREGYCAEILVSGGLNREGRNEADVMRDYLAKQGVPVEWVHADGQGNNTWMTARNAAQLMRRRNLDSVIVVSQFFHLTRAALAFRQAGVAPVYTAHAEYFELRDVYSVAREVPALASYALRPYLWPDWGGGPELPGGRHEVKR